MPGTREDRLPKWAQEQLTRLRYDVERLTRERDRAQQRAEKLSGEVQEALDCIWACAREGSSIAQTAKSRYNVGESLRAGTTDY